MKVLWLGGIVLPDIAKKENIPIEHGNGWLIELSKTIGYNTSHKLTYLFDNNKSLKGKLEYLNYYGVKCKQASTKKFGNDYISEVAEIIKKESPDVIHIWGTEYAHTLGMIEACEKICMIDRVVISIQGLITSCALHYTAGLPSRIINRYTLRDFLRRSNIKKAKNNFVLRSEFEKESIRKVKHIIGRTEYDEIICKQINPNIIYHHNNETLREEFYEGQWNIDNCNRHTIFCSQSHYPIKGVHFILEALIFLREKFPDIHLYVGGKDYMNMKKLYLSSYGKYLVDIIKKYHLEENVSFLGLLSAKQMKEQYLSANVFVSASSIENSPNSLGEAMILGTPCVSSRVGGVHSIFSENEDGFFYPYDEPYMLAAYIEKIFEDDKLAQKFSCASRIHAKQTHDREKNYKDLLIIYNNIICESDSTGV